MASSDSQKKDRQLLELIIGSLIIGSLFFGLQYIAMYCNDSKLTDADAIYDEGGK
jgi:hypothetical protein